MTTNPRTLAEVERAARAGDSDVRSMLTDAHSRGLLAEFLFEADPVVRREHADSASVRELLTALALEIGATSLWKAVGEDPTAVPARTGWDAMREAVAEEARKARV